MTHFQLIRQSVLSTHRIDELPSIPTQTWVEQCAEALCTTSPRVAVASLVCSYIASEDHLNIFSSGACIAGAHPGGESDSRITLSLQDRCERLSKLGLPISAQATQTGLVAPMQSLSASWSQSPAARIFSGTQLVHPIIHILPIRKVEQSHLCLLNLYGFIAGEDGSAPSETLALISALHSPLRLRATAALEHVNNPRAWLTDREQHVLELLIEGHSVRSIAEQLGRSAHTVHDHVKNLHKKIGASSRGELIAKALGHTPDELQLSFPEPTTYPFPGEEPLTELKPEKLIARPLRG